MAQAKIRIEDQNTLQDAVLNLGPFATLVERVWIAWSRQDPAWRMMAALGRALALIASRTEVRRRARLERHRAMALRDGEDVALTATEVKTLKAAAQMEGGVEKGQRGAPAVRKQAARLRAGVVDAVLARGEARRADLRLAQSIELDAVREGWDVAVAGPVLEAKRGQRDKRLRTRDGLVMLHESGAISKQLLAVGLRYRAWYEVTQASLKSCLEVSDRAKGATTTWSQCRAAQRRAALANRVRMMEAAVSTRLHPDALVALRAIAGEARTVNSITTAARRRVRLAEGLALALTLVADNLPEAR